jgi:hypothetical protein
MGEVALFVTSAALTIGQTYLQAKAANAKASEVNAIADRMDALNQQKVNFDKLQKSNEINKLQRHRIASIRSTMAYSGLDTEGGRAKVIAQGTESEAEGKQSVLTESAGLASKSSSLSTEYQIAANTPAETSYLGLAAGIAGGAGMTAASKGTKLSDVVKLFS